MKILHCFIIKSNHPIAICNDAKIHVLHLIGRLPNQNRNIHSLCIFHTESLRKEPSLGIALKCGQISTRDRDLVLNSCRAYHHTTSIRNLLLLEPPQVFPPLRYRDHLSETTLLGRSITFSYFSSMNGACSPFAKKRAMRYFKISSMYYPGLHILYPKDHAKMSRYNPRILKRLEKDIQKRMKEVSSRDAWLDLTIKVRDTGSELKIESIFFH